MLVALLAPLAAGFTFSVPAGSKECFEESANVSDHMQGTWTAGPRAGAAMDSAALSSWRVSVTGPTGDSVYSVSGESSGSFDYHATAGGVYVVCFANEHADAGSKPSLVTAKITVGDPPDLIQLAKTEHLSPIEERIKSLHESMNAVRDLQDQMREQDEAQSKMTRSTRSWLLYFTLIEAIVLVAMTTWQNLYLKSFFEVKRVV